MIHAVVALMVFYSLHRDWRW